MCVGTLKHINPTVKHGGRTLSHRDIFTAGTLKMVRVYSVIDEGIEKTLKKALSMKTGPVG